MRRKSGFVTNKLHFENKMGGGRRETGRDSRSPWGSPHFPAELPSGRGLKGGERTNKVSCAALRNAGLCGMLAVVTGVEHGKNEATISTIAEALNMTPGTVSRAFKPDGRVNAGKRVLETAERWNNDDGCGAMRKERET